MADDFFTLLEDDPDLEVDRAFDPERGPYEAIVVDNADPDGEGKVTFLIPKIIDPSGAWARPIGRSFGAQLGMWRVPKKQAVVLVWFLMGDLEMPYYIPGGFGAKDKDVPTFIAKPYRGGPVQPADADKIWCWEGDRFILGADERPGNEYIGLYDKLDQVNGKPRAVIEYDAKEGALSLSSKVITKLASDLALAFKGEAVSLNGASLLLKLGMG